MMKINLRKIAVIISFCGLTSAAFAEDISGEVIVYPNVNTNVAECIITNFIAQPNNSNILVDKSYACDPAEGAEACQLLEANVSGEVSVPCTQGQVCILPIGHIDAKFKPISDETALVIEILTRPAFYFSEMFWNQIEKGLAECTAAE